MTTPLPTHASAPALDDNNAAAGAAAAAVNSTAAPAPAAEAAADSATDAAAAAPADADADSAAAVAKPKGRLRGRRRADAEGAGDAPNAGASVDSNAPDAAAAVAAPAPAKTGRAPQRVVRVAAQIPQSLLSDPELARHISVLPSNYNFEIYKTIWRLREAGATMVGLQFPEGLLMYACVIADILHKFAQVDTLIMGDVTYGACCVDDFTARALGCDFMVHYGHSCLVPIDVSTLHMLYVFVDIAIDSAHLVRALKAHFQPDARLVLAGTIQFATAIAAVAAELQSHFAHLLVPQSRPLSKGEVLGCTSPRFDAHDAVVFLADGRFHLESMMIHNPHIGAFFKYDPYNKKLTREVYAYEDMYALRKKAIATATKAKRWGLILGTLGRQGNTNILARLEGLLRDKNLPYTIVLLSEIFPDKLAKFAEIEAWVQVACPRLSIDWGYAFHTPLLSSYEAEVALEQVEWQAVYPMDYYAADGGKWANYNSVNKQSAGHASNTSVNPIRARKEARAAAAAAKVKMEIAYAPEETQ